MRLYLHLKVTEFRSTEHTKVIVFVANNKLPCFRDPKTLAVHQTYMVNAPQHIWSPDMPKPPIHVSFKAAE